MIITHQQQPCPTSCTSTCIAMIAAMPAGEVIRRFHERYRSGKVGFGEVLKEIGIPYRAFMSDERVMLGSPGAYLVTVPSLNIVAGNHNVVVEFNDRSEWVLHDPCYGKEGKKWYTHSLPRCDSEVMLSSGYAIDAFVSLDDLKSAYGVR